MLVHMLVTEGAALPALARNTWSLRGHPGVSVVSQILQNTGPAIDVTTLCDTRGNHLGKIFHANWALHIWSISHIENDLPQIPPIDIFIGIMPIQHVVLSISPHALEGWLHTVVFCGPVFLWTSPPTPSFRAISIWVISLVIVFILVSIAEP